MGRRFGPGKAGSSFPARRRVALLASLWPLLALSAAANGDVGKPPRADSALLRERLAEGGYVIYIRHAATGVSDRSDATADLGRCETQRNLSALGRRQATRIGEAFRALGIEVGEVLTSPYCRCRDTARLAFGRYTVDEDLYFAMHVAPEHRRRITSALRAMLATPPAPGTNTVLVSHTANLSEATGIWPKPEGVAYVFRPLPDGRSEALAEVLPGDWSSAAATAPAAVPPAPPPAAREAEPRH